MAKQLLPLTFLLIMVAAAGYFLILDSKPASVEKGLLFADLAQQANDITQIRISNHQGVLLEASLQENMWIAKDLQQHSNYPLEQSNLTQLVQSLMQARLYQAKTSKSENYARLGLQAIEAQDSQATLVELTANEHNWAALVGDTASTGGSYIRLPEQAQTWLLDQNVLLPLDANAWLRPAILDLEREEIAKISRVDDKAWSIEKSEAEDGGFDLLAMPTGRSLKYDTILDSTINTLLSLGFDQIQPKNEVFWQGLQPVAKFELFTVKGDKVVLELAELDDNNYVQLHSDTLQSYWQNWIYQLSGFAAGQLNKSLDDFLLEPDNQAEQIEKQAVDEGDSPL